MATAVAVMGLTNTFLRANGLVISVEPVRKSLLEELPPSNVVQFGDYSADLLASEPTEPLLYKALSGATYHAPPPRIVSQPSPVSMNAGGAVTLRVNATGTGALSYQWRLAGKNISGATASVYSFNALATGVYDCVITDAVSSVKSAQAKVTVLGGTFHGLIERNMALNGNLASRIEVTTTSSGACSYKITSGSLSCSATGQISVGKTSQAVLEVPVANVGTLALVMDASGNKLTGTLKNAGGTSSASVSAWRNPWAETAGNAAKVKGPYTFYFEQSDSSVSLPQGYGHASFEVNGKTGNLIMVGSLACGSAFTGSTFVGKEGQVLLYAPLYTNRGSVAGTLSVAQGMNAPINNAVNGTATWSKPASIPSQMDTYYPAGFGPIPLNVSGGLYVPPVAGGRIMSLSVAVNNAALAFKLGGLDEGIDQLLTVSNPSPRGLTNTASFPANFNVYGVTLPTLTAASGLFAGQFTLSGTSRIAPFSGRIVTTGGQTKGYGFFLLPKVPAGGETSATAPKLSGQVILKPAGP